MTTAIRTCGRSGQGFVDAADRINDIVVDALSVFRTDADLDETVEYIEGLAASVRAVFDFLSFGAVK